MDLFKLYGTISLKGVEESEKQIREVTNTAEKSSSKLSKFGGFMAGVGKGVLAVTGAVTTGAIGLVKQVSSSYGALQQSIGGIETLFKDSASKVIENANNAYTTAGISANEYMQQVTSFSASLLQALDGDTEKACESADMAIRDMADNANKMGTSMEMIQNAYQGFSKQNYTMLDNLKLGYGGTKTEMERLLKDASKISGIKYDISNLNDVYQAIHVIQQELGITGTTALEAGATIEGSFNSLSASWQNFLAGLGNPDADMKQLVDNLAKGISGAINNVTPVINNMVQVLPTVADALIGAVGEMLPTLINTFTELITKVLDAIIQLLPNIIPPVIDCLMAVAQALIENLPVLVDAVLQLVMGLAQALTEAMPMLMPIIVSVIGEIVNLLINNLPLLVEIGIQLTMALAQGLIDALPMLIDMIPTITENLITALLLALPKLWESGGQLLGSLISGLLGAIPKLISAIPQIIMAIINSFANAIPNMFSSGQGLITGGILEGIKSAWSGVVDWFTSAIDWIKNLWTNFTNWLQGAFKMPHFTFEGSWNPFDWGTQGLPTIGVEWYAKGGIMTQPTLFGVNPSTGNAMVGGEAGAEAIAPISELQSYVRESVKQEMNEVNDSLTRLYDFLTNLLPQIKDNMDRPIVLDSGAMVSATVEKMDNSLGNRTAKKLRYGV